MLAWEFYITIILPQVINEFPFLCLLIYENFKFCEFKFIFTRQLIIFKSWWKILKFPSLFYLKAASPTLFTSSSSWNVFVWSTSWGSHFIFVSDQSHVTDKPVICSTIPATCRDSGGSQWWTLCLSQMLLTYETEHTVLLDNVSLLGKITFQFICQWTSLVQFHIFLFYPLVPAYRLTLSPEFPEEPLNSSEKNNEHAYVSDTQSWRQRNFV